jgi:hypothetical protein
MKRLVIFLLIGAAFFTGIHFGSSRTPQQAGICLDFADLSKEELQEYLALKEQKQKYDKANEILAKMIQIFIADMGLHDAGEQLCKINSTEFPLAHAAKVSPPPPRKENTQPPPVATLVPEPPPPPATVKATGHGRSSSLGHGGISAPNALGAIRALYQAILWRAADAKSEVTASEKFSNEGWNAYIHNGQNLIRGPEFSKQIVPNHTSEQIINHLYAVFMGRCAFPQEMKEALDNQAGDGPARLVESLITYAHQNIPDQVYAGGFSPSTCIP